MNKKVLVLTLALVVAFASSAMAAVNFGGEFGAKIEQDVLTWDEEGSNWWNTATPPHEPTPFKLLEGKYEFSRNLKLNLKSSNDTWNLALNFANESVDVVDSQAGAIFSLDGDAGYTLKVNDDLFALTVWQGAKNNQGYVNDPFSLVRGRRENAASTIRAKAPIMDVANVTLQLEPGSSVLGFVTADVAGAELGLAAQRKFGASIYDTVVLHGAYDFEVAKVTVGGGLSMDNTPEAEKLEDALAYAVKVEAPVTDQIKAEASYVVKQAGWKGNGKDSAVATLKGTYKADDLTVNGSFTTEGKHKNVPADKDNRTTTIALDGTYNVTADIKATAGAEYKIEKDKFELDTINTTKVNASVSAPLVADLATAEVKLGYTGDNLGAIQVGTYLFNPDGFGKSGKGFRDNASFALAKSLLSAEANIKVTPVAKLEVTPSVSYKSFKDGNKVAAQIADIKKLRDSTNGSNYLGDTFTAGSIVTLKADATYKVGSGATITLSAGNNAYNFTEILGDSNRTLKYNNPFASVAVKVTF